MKKVLDKLNPYFPFVLLRKGTLPLIVFLIIILFSIKIKELVYWIPEGIVKGGILIGSLGIIITIIYYYIFCYVTTLWVEEDEIIVERGIFNKITKRIPIYKVTDSMIKQDLIDRIIGSAALYINTAGHPGYETIIKNLKFKDAQKFYSDFLKILKNLQNRGHEESE